MENKRDFKGIWVPAEIWTDRNLTITERLVFNEITQTNGTADIRCISDFLGLTERRVKKAVRGLCVKKYVSNINGNFKSLK